MVGCGPAGMPLDMRMVVRPGCETWGTYACAKNSIERGPGTPRAVPPQTRTVPCR